MVCMLRILAAIASVLVLFAPLAEPTTAGTQDAAAAIRKLFDEIMAADNAGDLERVVATYTESAIMIPANAPDIAGTAAIRKHYVGAFEKFKLQLAASADEIRVADKWAVVRGRVTGSIAPKPDGAPFQADDKFMAVVEQGTDGKWRVARLIWNSAKSG